MTSTSFAIYHPTSSQDVWIKTTNQSMPSGFSLTSTIDPITYLPFIADIWQYIAVGCNQDRGRPSLLCFAYNWRSASDFSKKELNFYNSTYTESLSDSMMIGDTVCSFTGWLKSFSVYQGSTNFMDRISSSSYSRFFKIT